MKLWQKNYLAVLSVSFALLFSVCAALLVQQNDHAFQAEKQRVEGAFATARQAVAGAAALYTDGEAALSAMNRALSVTEGLGTDGRFVLFRDGQVCHGTADTLPALWSPQTTAGRALFLSTVLARVPLPGTHVFRGRVEHFFPKQARKADCITSRAFMPWPQLLELVAPHLADDGIVVILAREEPPAAGDIDGWELVGSFAYTADNVHRWFWALRRRAEG